MTIQELADLCAAQIKDGNTSQLIHSAADIVSAQPGQVTQLTNKKYSKYLQNSNASACFIAEDFIIEDKPEELVLLICKDPEMSFIKALDALHPQSHYQAEIASQAVVAKTATLGASVYIGPYAVVGENVEIGDNCEIFAGVYIGDNTKIGKNCRIYPYAVIYNDTIIGNDAIIHSGAVIGADGFGYKFRNNQHIKVPQVGNVVIGDSVEIGANSCIDRGALGSTRIGSGSKIDNLVQIGHNNKIGQHVIMCGQVGVSGSCSIEDYAVLAGSSGVADHVTIGKGAVVMARSGIANDVASGTHVFGSPAKIKNVAYKEHIAISKLPELMKTVKRLEEKIQQLEMAQQD